MSELWPWVALALLGAYHGINPGMGWLFAVARGLQEKRRSVVVQSLLPIAVGHGDREAAANVSRKRRRQLRTGDEEGAGRSAGEKACQEEGRLTAAIAPSVRAMLTNG